MAGQVISVLPSLLLLFHPSFGQNQLLLGQLEKNSFQSDEGGGGLDPAEYFRLKRIEKLQQRGGAQKRRRNRRKGAIKTDLASSPATHGAKKRRKSSSPKVEFLVPETYEPPPPECSGGDGMLSGMTFINFLISAIAVGANLVSNINSNQRNNNNNNNDNNDNVANFNFVNNNNGANNQNTIQICKSNRLHKKKDVVT